MYRQICIEPKQRHLQSILWRNEPTDEIETFELNTVTYGTTSAPYLAIKCLTTLGREQVHLHPNASNVILSDFYVDDLITGGEQIHNVIHVVKDVTNILKDGGFELRKWTSNSPEVLEELQPAFGSDRLEFGTGDATKTLGLYWTNYTDSLRFNIKDCTIRKTITKRVILSEISQIFDPLGLLAPCIITEKILMQKLWLLKLSWDESLPQDVHSKWKNFREKLSPLNLLTIPRHAICSTQSDIQLHGFADASQDAYGACIYLRSTSSTGDVQVKLLIAKTRVAPVKSLTIPRLELCAATLLAKLIQEVAEALTINTENKIWLWSDSTVTLHWITSPASTLQVFVSNRVSQIQHLTEINSWHHIRSEDNPADLLSRGVSPDNLIHNNLWWHGPTFLKNDSTAWPKSELQFRGQPLESKSSEKVFHVLEQDTFPMTKFSSITRLKRTVAYCQRFIKNCRTTQLHRVLGHLTIEELEQSMVTLIKLSQRQHFITELKMLRHGHHVASKSRLLRLHPFVDKDNIIRVGGRIKDSAYAYDKRHPIVLGRTHLTKLILQYEHQRMGHAGLASTLASVRENYWPISGRTMLKKILHSCVICFKVRPQLLSPIMGNLPAERVTQAPPFYHTGVDYAGPFQIKDRTGRGCKIQKVYLCLFICMTTKAIHLELVTELSMEIFMAAFRRFYSRRGKPRYMYSDNATNFVAANRELAELQQFLQHNNEELMGVLANQGTSWKFIPPRAPHFGGLWESGVKLVKNHLRRMIGKTYLTYELFYTILTQIEAILNSRPLIPLSSDPNDLQALTPAHFLIGRRLTAAPDLSLSGIPENRLTKFQFVQHIQQQFWNRWKREYVSELQVRMKWNRQRGSLQEGDLVIIKDDHIPPLQWKLGRVLAVFPGKDGIARVATIRTQGGILKRAFSKICPLPTDDQPV